MDIRQLIKDAGSPNESKLVGDLYADLKAIIKNKKVKGWSQRKLYEFINNGKTLNSDVLGYVFDALNIVVVEKGLIEKQQEEITKLKAFSDRLEKALNAKHLELHQLRNPAK